MARCIVYKMLHLLVLLIFSLLNYKNVILVSSCFPLHLENIRGKKRKTTLTFVNFLDFFEIGSKTKEH